MRCPRYIRFSPDSNRSRDASNVSKAQKPVQWSISEADTKRGWAIRQLWDREAAKDPNHRSLELILEKQS
jgi:hypothetical protein